MTSPVGTQLKAMVFPLPESTCSKQLISEGQGTLNFNPHLRLAADGPISVQTIRPVESP